MISHLFPTFTIDTVKLEQAELKFEKIQLNLLQYLVKKVAAFFFDPTERFAKTIIENSNYQKLKSRIDKELPKLGKKIDAYLIQNRIIEKILSQSDKDLLFRGVAVYNADQIQAEIQKDSEPSIVFSSNHPLYNAKPNAAVRAQGGMFGDWYTVADGKTNYIELDKDHVKIRKNPDTKKTEYQMDGEEWIPSTEEGIEDLLPSTTIKFNEKARESYSGKYSTTAAGLPNYPYFHLKADDNQKSNAKEMALGALGPNHAGDGLVTRIHPKTGELQIALIYRKNENVWAVPGGMRDHGEKCLAAAKREFIEEAGSEKEERLAYLEKDENWVFVWHGINVKDFRNTRHSWMETSVNALILDKENAVHWEQLKPGDDASKAKWLTINADTVRNWAGEKDKLFSLHTEFIMLTILNSGFQKKLIEQTKGDEKATTKILELIIEANRFAPAFGIIDKNN